MSRDYRKTIKILMDSRDETRAKLDEALAEVERLKTWKRRTATVRHELESENQCLREQLRARVRAAGRYAVAREQLTARVAELETAIRLAGQPAPTVETGTCSGEPPGKTECRCTPWAGRHAKDCPAAVAKRRREEADG